MRTLQRVWKLLCALGRYFAFFITGVVIAGFALTLLVGILKFIAYLITGHDYRDPY